MEDWEREFLADVDRIIEERKATLATAHQLLNEAENLVSANEYYGITVVGDPNTRLPIELYELHLLVLRRYFSTSQQKAWRDINDAGSWTQIVGFAVESWKGYKSLFFLKCAAYLYRIRVRDLINVQRHQATIMHLFPQRA